MPLACALVAEPRMQGCRGESRPKAEQATAHIAHPSPAHHSQATLAQLRARKHGCHAVSNAKRSTPQSMRNTSRHNSASSASAVRQTLWGTEAPPSTTGQMAHPGCPARHQASAAWRCRRRARSRCCVPSCPVSVASMVSSAPPLSAPRFCSRPARRTGQQLECKICL